MSERIDDIMQKMKKNKELQKRKTELILKEIRKREEYKEYANKSNRRCK